MPRVLLIEDEESLGEATPAHLDMSPPKKESA